MKRARAIDEIFHTRGNIAKVVGGAQNNAVGIKHLLEFAGIFAYAMASVNSKDFHSEPLFEYPVSCPLCVLYRERGCR